MELEGTIKEIIYVIRYIQDDRICEIEAFSEVFPDVIRQIQQDFVIISVRIKD